MYFTFKDADEINDANDCLKSLFWMILQRTHVELENWPGISSK